MSDEEFRIFTAIQRLWGRVLDRELRDAVGDFVEVCSRASLPGPGMDTDKIQTALREKQARVTARYGALNELFGERLRRELDRRFLASGPAGEAAPPAPDARPA